MRRLSKDEDPAKLTPYRSVIAVARDGML